MIGGTSGDGERGFDSSVHSQILGKLKSKYICSNVFIMMIFLNPDLV